MYRTKDPLLPLPYGLQFATDVSWGEKPEPIDVE